MPDEFPNPPTPYSLKVIVGKIKANHEYAKFIHKKVSAARQGDAAAAATVQAHFEPDAADLQALQIPAEDADAVKKCTDPRTHFLDFAHYM